MASNLGPCDGHASTNIRARTYWLLVRDDNLEDTHLPSLALCGHCSDKHAHAMVTGEWCQAEDQRDEISPAGTSAHPA